MKFLVKNILWLGLRIAYGSAVVPLRVRGGPAEGSTLNLDIRTQGAYWLGTYDKYSLARIPLSRYLKPGQIAWDCGSFVGYYAAIFRKIVGAKGQVFVFEASSTNFTQLQKVPVLNDWGNVHIFQRAVGPDHADIEFAGEFGGGSGPAAISPRFKSRSPAATEMVRSYGIDELISDPMIARPQLIKFDLEGAEEQALHNGSVLFGEDRPVILLEMHGSSALDATARFLDQYNYCAVAASSLERVQRSSDDRWLASLRSKAFRSGESLIASGGTAEMMLVLPREHPDLQS